MNEYWDSTFVIKLDKMKWLFLALFFFLSSCYRYLKNDYTFFNNYDPNKTFKLEAFHKIGQDYKSLEDIRLSAKKVTFSKDTTITIDSAFTLKGKKYKVVSDVYVQTMCGAMGAQQKWETLENEYTIFIAPDSNKVILKNFLNHSITDLNKNNWDWELGETFRYVTFYFDENILIVAPPSGEREMCFYLIWFKDKIYKIQLAKRGSGMGAISSFCEKNIGFEVKNSVCSFSNEIEVTDKDVLIKLRDL